MSTKGKHRMTLAESLRRRIAARRAMARTRREVQLIEVRRIRMYRQLQSMRRYI